MSRRTHRNPLSFAPLFVPDGWPVASLDDMVSRYPGHVYFIHAPKADLVKIGYSRDPGKRLLDLNTASTESLHWIGSIPGSTIDEKALHKEFKHLRAHGEWFKYTIELESRIEDLAEDYEQVQAWFDMHGRMAA